ncbi:unnamed protein product [Paramecium pentaurelia]|uniref:T-complex protein 1 subunit zeta n=1 Tax=Paramecium pentaurelia TaxID=43138 RepID=A0A8S1SU67_9CILI|nr:unnamed protein product [Paramecium pentaurelia]
MSSVQFVNSKAEVLRKYQALAMNINAAAGLMEVMKSNLGPKGTLKMLVGGAGQIKLTKDGAVLLSEMQIQHPTAAMIARSATAQDDIIGDGTTSNVLLIGALMKQAERLLAEGIHPRVITEGFELARKEALSFLDTFKYQQIDKAVLINVARTSLISKLTPDVANQIIEIVVDAVQIVHVPEKPIDLFMVEIMHMQHKMGAETELIRGLVLDHGARHPDMPKFVKKCYILNLNVSLEYEKTEVHSGFFYNSAEDREKLARSERKLTDDKCQQIIDFKRKVCEKNGYGFAVINQKGIDPVCLEMFAKEGIVGIRRAKKRNMERIAKACGGNSVNAVEDLTESDLGYCEVLREYTLGEEKYTFIEGVQNPASCTILIRGPNEHTIAQIKDAIRDGLRAVKNAIEDKCVIPGAGAFEIATSVHLQKFKDSVAGKAKLGVQAFAESLLVIPKALAENCGYDVQETLIQVTDEYIKNNIPVGVSINEQGFIAPIANGIFDNYCCKRSWLNIAPTLAQQLLLVDEIMRAGKQAGGAQQ